MATNFSAPPYVSVIIPVYHDRLKLSSCLSALDTQVYPRRNFEVLVVINDGKPHEHDADGAVQVRYLHERRPGAYAARNRGVLEARGSILAFTDVDCIPDPQWLVCGVRALQDNSSCGYVGGKIEFIDDVLSGPRCVKIYERAIYFRQMTYVGKGGFAATANMFVWSHEMMRVGLFDGRLKSGGDVEWGLRARALGSGGWYEEEAIVRHRHRGLAELLKKMRRVAGGAVDLDRIRGTPTRVLPLLHDLKDECRLLRRDLALISAVGPNQSKYKAEVKALALMIFFVRLGERWRLRFGGTSVRA